jgi:hypothetical protein
MARAVVSVDLGTVNDYSAITHTEVVSRFQEKGRVVIPGEMQLPIVNEIVCRHIERIPLGTSYPDIIERVRIIMDNPDVSQQAILIVDQTGCGLPVVQAMRRIPGLAPISITITNGNSVNDVEGGYNVPKRDLVSALQLAFQTHRLKFSKGINYVDDLIHELRNFKVKIKKSAESYEAWRETDHDDIVLSLAMAVWMHRRLHGETTQMDRKNDSTYATYDVLRHGIAGNKKEQRSERWAGKSQY